MTTVTVTQTAVSGSTDVWTLVFQSDGSAVSVDVPATVDFSATVPCDSLTITRTGLSGPVVVNPQPASSVCLAPSGPIVLPSVPVDGGDLLFIISLWFWAWFGLSLWRRL